MQNSSDPNLKCFRIPVAFTSEMKAEIERRSRDLGISEQGYIRLSVKMMMNKGKITPDMIINGDLS